jgi:hypothetical protein
MDGQRFDAIARGFAARLTRRRAVAGALGLAVTALGAGDAKAAVRPTCRAYGAGCNRSSQCCDGRCDTRRTTPRARRNRCTCPVGFDRCKGACVDLQETATHCGVCGNACPSSQVCQGGECVCAGADEIYCAEQDACADLDTDRDHCGACGNACLNAGPCVAGVCPQPCEYFEYTKPSPTEDDVICITKKDGTELQGCSRIRTQENGDPVACDTDADCANWVSDCGTDQPNQRHWCGCMISWEREDPPFTESSPFEPRGYCFRLWEWNRNYEDKTCIKDNY